MWIFSSVDYDFLWNKYSSFQKQILTEYHHILGPPLGFEKGVSDSHCFHGAILEETDKYTDNTDPLW